MMLREDQTRTAEAVDPRDAASEGLDVCLVAGCDEGFAMPLAVTLFSALRRLKAPTVRLYVIDGGIGERSKRRLERVVQRVRPDTPLCWLTPPQMSGLQGARHLSPATYLRLFIPQLLPPEVKQALYLDCDLLVRGDVAALARTDLGGAALGAARDYAVTQIGHPFSGVKDYEELGISADAPYFNAGVLLMNLSRWRKDRLANGPLNYAARHGAALGNCDQDALNATMSRSWKRLDDRWNVQYALFYLHDLPPSEFSHNLRERRPALLREAGILHFTGTPKPWNHWCGHPAADEWVRAFLSSRWFAPLEAAIWAVGFFGRRSWYKMRRCLRLIQARERAD